MELIKQAIDEMTGMTVIFHKEEMQIFVTDNRTTTEYVIGEEDGMFEVDVVDDDASRILASVTPTIVKSFFKLLSFNQ